VSARPRILVVLPALAFGLGACTVTATLSAEDVAGAAEDAFEQESGIRFPITCPEDLEAEVGAETRCVLTNSDTGEEYGVSVTVTSVENGSAQFDVRVDNQPQG
jgi:hypothetical protein